MFVIESRIGLSILKPHCHGQVCSDSVAGAFSDVACICTLIYTGLAVNWRHILHAKFLPHRAKEKKKLEARTGGRTRKKSITSASAPVSPSSLGTTTLCTFQFIPGSRILGRSIRRETVKMVTEVVNKKKGQEQEEHIIKPQATTPAVDTSEWPLLLKNYDNRE